MQQEEHSDLIMGVIFIVAIFALPVWNWVSERWNKRKAYIFGSAFLATVLMVLISLNAATPFSLLLGLCVFAGIGVGAAHVLPWAIIPDAIEWDELNTGERHEGMFYSLVTLMQKIASSVAIPLVLLVLDATGYMPNATQQPDNALLGIRIVIGPIPAVILFLGILFAVLYPLDRERFAEVNRELESRRSIRPEKAT
jgi:GPH family glycoside/pentoside/hexuronide:cation symporter